jgi:hypothetical protein
LKKDQIIKDLSERVADLEQQQLANNIVIAGIPITKGEYLHDLVNNIASTCELSMNDVVEVRRERVKRTVRIPPIVVRFSSAVSRELWLKRKNGRMLTTDDALEDGSVGNIYINEQMTPANKKLFYQAKLKGKEKNYKYILHRNGKVFVRKTEDIGLFRIKSQWDVDNKIV